ncbi:hypothetical protein F443_12534 [Phytophthora nicotianae P1569]|uniref:Uncharacterized protein n=1 Tax=Phytophthora nicotianae P1569 TaxID=1317065 RepID=V9EV03_PHYNI|nr:hypothetical protein F443_12534 [Phytophthora nicotianae P1569]
MEIDAIDASNSRQRNGSRLSAVCASERSRTILLFRT